ncbi:MAG: LysE family translocator, partial [Maribacter sp.]
LVHTTLLAFGVSAVIKDNATIFNLIKIFGALYLIFLAASVYRGGNTISLDSDEKQEKSLASLYRQGFIMNVLNPKVTIFFLAFFPGFLFSDSMNTIVQFYVLGLLFIFVSTLVFGGIALLSGTIAGFLNDNGRTGSILKWLQIIVFVGIAVFLVFG